MTPEEQEAAWRHELWHRDIAQQMEVFKRELAENSQATAEIRDGMKDALVLLNSWQGAMRVLGWLAKPVSLVTGIVTAIVGYYALVRGK